MPDNNACRFCITSYYVKIVQSKCNGIPVASLTLGNLYFCMKSPVIGTQRWQCPGNILCWEAITPDKIDIVAFKLSNFSFTIINFWVNCLLIQNIIINFAQYSYCLK